MLQRRMYIGGYMPGIASQLLQGSLAADWLAAQKSTLDNVNPDMRSILLGPDENGDLDLNRDQELDLGRKRSDRLTKDNVNLLSDSVPESFDEEVDLGVDEGDNAGIDCGEGGGDVPLGGMPEVEADGNGVAEAPMDMNVSGNTSE